jgi:citrate lyase beta subunit
MLPGVNRQPIHTVYGGAHLFTPGICAKLGKIALRALDESGPFPGISNDIAERMRAKLLAEPVEDYRIDFEDGYGNRSSAEEDVHAAQAARGLAEAMRDRILPPFIGIRIKPLSEEHRARALRTLDIFLSTLLEFSAGLFPPNFAITIPKIEFPEQAAALAGHLDAWEARGGLAAGTLHLEMLVESPQAITGLARIFEAANGRCSGVHFGAYDYLASIEIPSTAQHLLHPACDFARHGIKSALSGRGIFLSDGATHTLPIGGVDAVRAGWHIHYSHVRHSLDNGFYQGWDLHPAQLVSRYAAVYSFFRDGWEIAANRLGNYLNQKHNAGLTGSEFDDAASTRGLLIFLSRALACGAVSRAEIDRITKAS